MDKRKTKLCPKCMKLCFLNKNKWQCDCGYISKISSEIENDKSEFSEAIPLPLPETLGEIAEISWEKIPLDNKFTEDSLDEYLSEMASFYNERAHLQEMVKEGFSTEMDSPLGIRELVKTGVNVRNFIYAKYETEEKKTDYLGKIKILGSSIFEFVEVQDSHNFHITKIPVTILQLMRIKNRIIHPAKSIANSSLKLSFKDIEVFLNLLNSNTIKNIPRNKRYRLPTAEELKMYEKTNLEKINCKGCWHSDSFVTSNTEDRVTRVVPYKSNPIKKNKESAACAFYIVY